MPSLTSRFAPSTTGPAHPGTLLAALLAWLDARHRGARLMLRFEDLDPQRCKPKWVDQMREDLAWLGLDWDDVQTQSERRPVYEEALNALADEGRLYPCSCSRSQIRQHGVRAPDGAWRYPNTCRGTPLPPGGWRDATLPLRMVLPPEEVVINDESGAVWTQTPATDQGDPIALRRDGAVAYTLASVVDDGVVGVNRIIRGRDLALCTPTQWQLQSLLGYPHPTYRHHLLFLEEREQKLAKLHGSIGVPELRGHYTGEALCGFIAHAAGLLPEPEPVSPSALLPGFSWERVRSDDVLIRWDGASLSLKSYSRSSPGAST